jgi:hypothetical protein
MDFVTMGVGSVLEAPAGSKGVGSLIANGSPGSRGLRLAGLAASTVTRAAQMVALHIADLAPWIWVTATERTSAPATALTIHQLSAASRCRRATPTNVIALNAVLALALASGRAPHRDCYTSAKY